MGSIRGAGTRASLAALVAAAGCALGASPASAADATVVNVESTLNLYGPELQVNARTRNADRVTIFNEERNDFRARKISDRGGRELWTFNFPSRAVDYDGPSYLIRVVACPKRGRCDVVRKRFRARAQGPNPNAVPEILSVVPQYDAQTGRLVVTVTGRNADEAIVSVRDYRSENTTRPTAPMRLLRGEVSGSSMAAVFEAQRVRLVPGQPYPIGVAIDNSQSQRTVVLRNNALTCLDLSIPQLHLDLPPGTVPPLPQLPLSNTPSLPGLPGLPNVPALQLPSIPLPDLTELALPCLQLPLGLQIPVQIG
jgi:hypothetical protein